MTFDLETGADTDWTEIPLPDEPADYDGYHDDEGAILHQLQWLRVRHEARRQLDDENRQPIVLPPIKRLDALLAEPDPPTRYRVEDVAPAGMPAVGEVTKTKRRAHAPPA